jgi:uncharacterized protein (DUF1015 family)
LVAGLLSIDSARLQPILSQEFEVDLVGDGVAGCRSAWELVEAHGGQHALGFGTVADGKWLFGRLKSNATIERLLPDRSADWRNLGVSILHELVLNKLIREQFDTAALGIQYVHLVSEVLEGVQNRRCDLACLVPPATMDDVERIASKGERMPAKSTYFYPKLLTGLVLNPIA